MLGQAFDRHHNPGYNFSGGLDVESKDGGPRS